MTGYKERTIIMKYWQYQPQNWQYQQYYIHSLFILIILTNNITFNMAQCSISPITNDDGNVHYVKMILQKKAFSISEEDRQLADFLLDQVIVFFSFGLFVFFFRLSMTWEI